MPVERQSSVEIAKNAREAATARPIERSNSGRTTAKVPASRPAPERAVVPSSIPSENVLLAAQTQPLPPSPSPSFPFGSREPTPTPTGELSKWDAPVALPAEFDPVTETATSAESGKNKAPEAMDDSLDYGGRIGVPDEPQEESYDAEDELTGNLPRSIFRGSKDHIWAQLRAVKFALGEIAEFFGSSGYLEYLAATDVLPKDIKDSVKTITPSLSLANERFLAVTGEEARAIIPLKLRSHTQERADQVPRGGQGRTTAPSRPPPPPDPGEHVHGTRDVCGHNLR
ncbi:hypothetical protein EW026_g7842 [Hermanssonia centrifuga]|uniref:Uncharacterized protein n=1 Tax=Hermanssonia centrifuga TaxID=98765 RepID=A0A4S4K880_9APHY|nr:hypothetical protein EW026_g7842 [Hermanssonia centrifuga]